MTAPQNSLMCPKCGADMRLYERNGVSIDQCTGCRGIFLDRGELERLMDAEGSYYADPRDGAGEQPYRGERDVRYQDKHGSSRGGHGEYRDEHGKDQRRRGFLGDLFG